MPKRRALLQGNLSRRYLLFLTWKQLFLWLKHKGIFSQRNTSPQGSGTSNRGAVRALSLEILPGMEIPPFAGH